MTYCIMAPLIVETTGENLGMFPTGFFGAQEDAQKTLSENCIIGFVMKR